MADEPLESVETEAAPAELSVRDELAAALTAQTEAVQAPAEGQIPAPKPEGQATDGPVRDEQGRFVAKPGETGQAPQAEPKTPQASAEPQADQTTAGTIGPPPSWSATAKAEFSKLPPLIQQEISKREADMERGKAQWQEGATRLNRLDAMFAPRAEQLRNAGIDQTQAVQYLLNAQQALETNPVAALFHLARSYGVDLRQAVLSQGQAQPGQPSAQQLPPELQHLASEVQTLKSALAQREAAAEQAQRSVYVDEAKAFAAKPEHIYFENVREDMAVLLKAGRAKDLADAYEQATWAHPEIRPILLRQQAEKTAAEAQAAARAKAEQARRASGSVTGSPTPGASPGKVNQGSTVREDLEAALREHAA